MTCLFSKRPNYIKLEEMATEATESVVNMPSFLQQKTYRKQALYNAIVLCRFPFPTLQQNQF